MAISVRKADSEGAGGGRRVHVLIAGNKEGWRVIMPRLARLRT